MNSLSGRFLLTLALGVASMLPAVVAAQVVYSDVDFPNTDWDLTVVTVNNGGSVTASQSATGGNGGSYFEISNTVNAGANSQVWGFHRNLNATYDPATSGEIMSIRYSEDSILLGGFGQGAGIAIRQGTNIYTGPYFLAEQTIWTNHSFTNLTASSFVPLPGSTGVPDFSPTGAPIEFGFVRSNGNGTPGNAYTTVGGIDNWQVSIERMCPSYTDVEFPSPGWDVTVVTVNNGGSVTTSQSATGGNTGSYFEISNSVNAGTNSQVWGFHRNLNATYDPATSGEIAYIDYSEDSILLSGFGQGAGIAIRQGTNIYSGPYFLAQQTTWTSQSFSGLTASSFVPLPGSTGVPDFSAAGAPIEFGFVRSNGNGTPGNQYTTLGGIDNWRVTIHCLCPSYSDDAFATSDWDLTLFTVNNGGSVATSQSATGGNTGSYFEISHTVNAGTNSQVWGFHRSTGATYDPSTSGAIVSIDYSEDAILLGGFGQGAGVAIRQGTNTYSGPYFLVQQSTWTNHSYTSLTASSFSPLPGSAGTPDFSRTGAPIEFGFVRSNGNGAAGNGYTTLAGIDNWQVTLHCEPTAAVSPQEDVEEPGFLRIIGNPLLVGSNSEIHFSLDGSEDVEFRVFNAAGRLTRLLMPFSRLEPGEHSIYWDGTSDDGRAVPHGMYFVRARLGQSGPAESQRILVLR